MPLVDFNGIFVFLGLGRIHRNNRMTSCGKFVNNGIYALRLPEQNGQPLPFVRLSIRASHS